MDFIIFTVAMAVLIYGADLIVKESERIAFHFEIPQYVIGATLVAMGTSLPELGASITAGLKGQPDLAVANVVGSNIFNIALILGVVFLIAKKIAPERDIFAKDSAWAIFPVVIFIMMGLDGSIDRVDGFLFLSLMFAYTLFLIKDAKEFLLSEIGDEEVEKDKFNWLKSGGFLIAGFVLLIVSANFAIESAVTIAKSFGVSEWLIGMFMIAIGTSLPELIVSIVAARKGNMDMSIGNIIGSNIANLSVVLGLSAVITPLVVDFQKSFYDITAMVIMTLILVFITANKLYNRSAGIVLIVAFLLLVKNALTTI